MACSFNYCATPAFVAVLVAVLLGISLTASAQTEPGGHGAHHPGTGAPIVPSGLKPSAPGLPGGGMGMSDNTTSGAGAQAGRGCGPMGCMGVGPKPFYASLMDLPSLTPEARLLIEDEAAQRLASGSEAIVSGMALLHQARSANDPVAVLEAVARLRAGVFQAESGAAALQAVSAGQQPRQIALTWFKGQMGVPAVGRSMHEEGPWGLSWFHVTTMTFLVAFLLGATLLYYARLHRISRLVQRLTPDEGRSPGLAGSLKGAPAPAAPEASSQVRPAPEPAPVQTLRQWSGVLRVADIFYETPNVKTFRLTELEGRTIPFTFVPGQFLTFAAEVDGTRIRRSYTIASSPTQRDYVEITVKREEQGAESRYLHDTVAIGDRLEVSGPAGVFTFTGTEANSIVLISGGVGITPMMCITRYLTDRAFPGDIYFLHGTSTPQNFIFREELEYLRKRHANLHIVETVAHTDETPWTGAVGYISKEFIARAVPEIARRRVHVCGPPAMMEAVKSALAELGVPKSKIKSEAFGHAMGAVPARPAAGELATATSAAARPARSAQAQVQFKKSGKTGPLAPDKCVLEAAEAIGVAIDYSCRVGTCGICVVPLLEGAVTMEVEEGLLPADKAQGMILACQAKSVANLVVDA